MQNTNQEDISNIDIADLVNIPDTYYSITRPKQIISEAVRDGLEDNNFSLRKAAKKIAGMSYPQISRVTSGENYNINTLLKILDVLNLELKIVPKKRP